MNKRAKYLFKNAGILSLSNFASKILVFLLVPLYTSVLSTEEYGIYDLVMSTVLLIFPVLTLNIVDAVMRFSMDKTCSKNEIASIGIKYVTISICIVGAFLALLKIFNFLPSFAQYSLYIFFYYITYVLNQFFIQFAKGLERVKDMGIASVLGTVAMIGINILLLVVFKFGMHGFFIANILSQGIQVVYYIIRLRFWDFIKQLKCNRELEKQMLIYCIPLICTALGWRINSSADKYVVTLLCSVSANGILSVAYKIPSILNTFQGIFTQAWQLSAVKEYGKKDVGDFYSKTFVLLNIAISAVCSFLIILSKPLAHLLYANEFYQAWQYVPFLLLSSVFNCASGFIGPILSAKKDSKGMAMSAVYGAIVNLVMNIVLVYAIGVQGATIATAISSFIIYVYRKKRVKVELQVEQYWRILLTWGLLVLQAIAEVYLSSWLIELVIMATLVVINWNIILDTFRLVLKKKIQLK